MSEVRPRVLIGTHTYGGGTSATRRQQEAADAWLGLRDAETVNVQFARAPHEMPGLRTLPLLRRSSNSVTGRAGPEKPIVAECLDVLAAEAAARSIEYICLANSDIVFTQEAVDWIAEGGREGSLFSREDVEIPIEGSGAGTRAPAGMQLAGVDVFAFATSWWQANRRRFRPYILGEICWDNVYAAIVLCHADAAIENRRPLVRHERHPSVTTPSPHFGEYTRLLTALDAGYFSLWCRYWDGLRVRRDAGATEEDERAWAREVFTWPPSPGARLVQAARSARALGRYARWKMRPAAS